MIDRKKAKQLERVAEKIENLTQEELDYFPKVLLNKPLAFSISTSMVSVIQDDCDGDQTQTLEVVSLDNGDMCIQTNARHTFLRFRMPFIGGGRYPLVWSALRLLAFAIGRSQ